ncbi:hypothetical protein ACQKDB_16605 [Planococcus kocurii]|uniref:hypothetical protein n=1 Tax=Planococcus kocurii TaxID=1374 RepID=UPI003D015AC5
MATFEETKKRSKSKSRTALLDERDIAAERKAHSTKKKVLSSFADIAPIVDITDSEFFEMRNGEFMEILQITSKDIYSLNETDKDNDIYSLAHFFQAYLPSVKVVPLNTPVNLEIPKRHVLRDIRRNQNPYYLPHLEKKLKDLEFLENNRTDREFFLFIYSSDEKAMLENKVHARKLMARSNPLIELSLDKKLSILYQLANLNSKPLSEI